MKSLAWISTHRETGSTTLVVNTAAALVQMGCSVLVIETGNPDLICRWLDIPVAKLLNTSSPIDTSMGFDLTTNFSPQLWEQDALGYDYVFIDSGIAFDEIEKASRLADYTLASTDLKPLDGQLLPDLDDRIRKVTAGTKGIHQIIPTRSRTGEWSNNTDTLFALLEHFEEEQIANMIPE